MYVFVAICAITRPGYALVIGAVGGLIACAGCKMLEHLRIDDPVGCVPIHLFAGIWSLIAVAFFIEREKSEKFFETWEIHHKGRWELLGAQFALTVASCVWSACITLLLLKLINFVFPMRMRLQDELKGSDKFEHGILLSDTFENATRCSAFGTSTISRAVWDEQTSPNHDDSSNSSASNQGTESATATSEINHAFGIQNRADVIIASRISSNDTELRIEVNQEYGQINEQSNGGFSTSF